MEIESVAFRVEVAVHQVRKQRKSPENGDWKSLQSKREKNSWRRWNKESLLKMEIESLLNSASYDHYGVYVKQRKSPENGDWKYFLFKAPYFSSIFETKKVSWKWRLKASPLKSYSSSSTSWNKESLLKMEIERPIVNMLLASTKLETKKVSWKWRLKV